MQNYTALQVYLQDLQRAGVTDFANDIPFDFTIDSVAKLEEKPQNVQQTSTVAVQVETPKAPQPTKPVAPYADPSVNAKPRTKHKGGMVWSTGVENTKCDIQVVAFQKTIGLSQAFNDQGEILFSKMMMAIEQPLENIAYVMHSDMADMQEKLMQALKKDKPVLIVGQDSAEALTGKTLSELRENLTVEGLEKVGVIPHPHLLLKQPVLKRTAWQDLLKFMGNYKEQA